VVRVPLVVREDLQGGTRRGLLSVFLHKKYMHSFSFYLSGSVNKFLNFCVAYFPCCFLKTAIKISHSHFVHVAFVSILVFQTFDRLIFGTLTFSGTRWYMMTVRDTQMVRDQKKFENHWSKDWTSRSPWLGSLCLPSLSSCSGCWAVACWGGCRNLPTPFRSVVCHPTAWARPAQWIWGCRSLPLKLHRANGFIRF